MIVIVYDEKKDIIVGAGENITVNCPNKIYPDTRIEFRATESFTLKRWTVYYHVHDDGHIAIPVPYLAINQDIYDLQSGESLEVKSIEELPKEKLANLGKFLELVGE